MHAILNASSYFIGRWVCPNKISYRCVLAELLLAQLVILVKQALPKPIAMRIQTTTKGISILDTPKRQSRVPKKQN